MGTKQSEHPDDRALRDFRDGLSTRQGSNDIRRAVQHASITVRLARIAAADFETELAVCSEAAFLARVLASTSAHLRPGSAIDCSTGLRAIHCRICHTHARACRAFRSQTAVERSHERRRAFFAFVVLGGALTVGVPALVKSVMSDAALSDPESQGPLTNLALTLLVGLIFGLIAFIEPASKELFRTRLSLYGSFFAPSCLRQRGLLAAAAAVQVIVSPDPPSVPVNTVPIAIEHRRSVLSRLVNTIL